MIQFTPEYGNAIAICLAIYALAIAWFAMFSSKSARDMLILRFVSSCCNCIFGACLGCVIWNVPGRVFPNILIGIILGGIITYIFGYRQYLNSIEENKSNSNVK